MGIALSLSSFKKIQWVLALIAAGAMFYTMYVNFSDNETIYVSDVPEEKIQIPELAVELKPYEEYSNIIATRDIFNVAVVTSNSDSVAAASGELPSHLKVVGIIIAHPVQVIIEDSNLHQTYFINEGNAQGQGGITIQKVNKNQVILLYQGSTIAVPLRASPLEESVHAPIL